MIHPAEQYIADVMADRVVVGKWARLAVQRHVEDLREAGKRGFYFDAKKADRAIRFFSLLKLSQGEWSGMTFTLAPWQQFILWCIFGWRRIADKLRRFRMVHIEIARKNGKTTFAAGVALRLLLADGEAGAEVYAAATKREQSAIVFNEAKRMIRKSPDLRSEVETGKHAIYIEESGAKFVPLGADYNTLDGLNVHGAIVDELHAHKKSGVLDVLDSGTGSRRQPMIFMITTAGLTRVGIGYDMHVRAEKVLEGVYSDDTFFTIIYSIDEGDDWQDERCWAKANPNIGVSVKPDDLRRKAVRAHQMAGFQNEFLSKHMNIWTQQATRWLKMDKWKRCLAPIPDESLRGRRCFGGLDLSRRLDVTALAYLFPPIEADPRWRLKCRFWVPEATALEREQRDKVPYNTWGKQGHLLLTAGDVVDYDAVKAQVAADSQMFDVVEIGYDPYNATQTVLQMQEEGATLVEVSQRIGTLNSPTKEFEKFVVCGDLAHDGNPVMDWMASNVAVVSDANGNIRPCKKRSTECIDGIAAAVTALARGMLDIGEDSGSVYDRKDLIVI